MNNRGKVVCDMQALILLFKRHCPEQGTLTRLEEILVSPSRWHLAAGLFQEIRKKNLDAEKRADELLAAQYFFEEICAKTLYNLSLPPGPFDPDSPYWIAPGALALAKRLGLTADTIVTIVAS